MNNNNFETTSNFNTSPKRENHRAARKFMRNLSKQSSSYKKVIKDIRNVYGIGPNRLSDNKIKELLRKNNRIIHKPTEDQVKFISSYEKS